MFTDRNHISKNEVKPISSFGVEKTQHHPIYRGCIIRMVFPYYNCLERINFAGPETELLKEHLKKRRAKRRISQGPANEKSYSLKVFKRFKFLKKLKLNSLFFTFSLSESQRHLRLLKSSKINMAPWAHLDSEPADLLFSSESWQRGKLRNAGNFKKVLLSILNKVPEKRNSGER